MNPNCANPLSSTGCFTINTAAMNLTMDQFELDAELGLSIAKELNQGASFKSVYPFILCVTSFNRKMSGFCRFLWALDCT